MKDSLLKMAPEIIELLEDITMLNVEVVRCNRLIIEALTRQAILIDSGGTGQPGGWEE